MLLLQLNNRKGDFIYLKSIAGMPIWEIKHNLNNLCVHRIQNIHRTADNNFQ